MPNTAIPNIDLNKAAADVNQAIKDGAYIAIGLGVLGFQRAQVQRVELTKQLEAQLDHLASLPATLNAQAEGYAQTARAQAETARAQVNEQIAALTKAVEDAIGLVQAQLLKAVPADLPRLPDLAEQWATATKALEEQLQTVRTQLTDLAKSIDEQVQPVRQQVEEQVDKFEQRLPAGARNFVQSVRAAATAPEQAFRTVVGLN